MQFAELMHKVVNHELEHSNKNAEQIAVDIERWADYCRSHSNDSAVRRSQ